MSTRYQLVAGAFYGNPTNMYAAGTKVFNGTNKSASMNGWMVWAHTNTGAFIEQPLVAITRMAGCRY